MKNIRILLDGIKRRFRLRRICKALKIKPSKWQASYALRKCSTFPNDRRSGKTTAVVLRALVEDAQTPKEIYEALQNDPDFGNTMHRQIYSYYQYCEMAEICRKAGVRVAERITKQQFQQEALCERHWNDPRCEGTHHRN